MKTDEAQQLGGGVLNDLRAAPRRPFKLTPNRPGTVGPLKPAWNHIIEKNLIFPLLNSELMLQTFKNTKTFRG